MHSLLIPKLLVNYFLLHSISILIIDAPQSLLESNEILLCIIKYYCIILFLNSL